MGKGRQRKHDQNQSNASSSAPSTPNRDRLSSKDDSNKSKKDGRKKKKQTIWTSIGEWCYEERHGLMWVMLSALLGMILGLGIGTGRWNVPLIQGYLTGTYGVESTWRKALASRIRSSFWYEVMLLQRAPWDPLRKALQFHRIFGESGSSFFSGKRSGLGVDPDDTRAFYALREMIVREEGGFVHPDLGLLIPAPSGAARGLGMVRSSYDRCRTHCFSDPFTTSNNDSHYPQQQILLRIPLELQMTRSVALQTLLPLLPHEVRRRAPLEDLDDAALLVLLLAHEKGKGHESRFEPYISSLPREPSCGYFVNRRHQATEHIALLAQEFGLDVNGWHSELLKAAEYAERIAIGLARDYGNYLTLPAKTTAVNLIQWSLCQVASRATAGEPGNGNLRLVPLIDMINHDVQAGPFIELTGEESIQNGDFIDASTSDMGTFVVRSIRHGKHNPLKKNQELLANYNVPYYSPLDWFVNLGFVPPERTNRWVKIDNVLPKVKRQPGSNVNPYDNTVKVPPGGLGIIGDRSSITLNHMKIREL